MSRTSIVLAVTATALFSAAHALASPAVIGSKLNLRAGPGANYAIVVVMPAGASVEVKQCGDEWCRVTYAGHSGFASRSHLGSAADSYASATPKPAAEQVKPTLTGPQVWQWDNAEWRDAHWRRLGWHNRMKQP